MIFDIIRLLGGINLGKTKRWIKNNLIFFISLIILLISIIFSIVILSEFRIQSNLESTRVGHIYLGNQDNDYENRLDQTISEFISEAEYQINYQNISYELDFSQFEFLSEETIDNISKDNNNLAYFSVIDTNDFETSLKDNFSAEVINSINLNNLISDIENNLGKLDYFSSFSLTDYFSEIEAIILEKTYSTTNQTIINQLSQIDEIEINSLEQFSLLSNLSDYNISNESLSFLASMMQDLTLESHFTNYVFQPYYHMPNWANESMNVKILKANDFDFSFYNNFNQNYKFVIETIDSNTIKLMLQGMPYVNSYDIEEIVKSIPYDTIIIDDPTLDDITYKVDETDTEIIYQKLLENGLNGSLHKFVRTITKSDSSTETIILFYIKFSPTTEIISENIITKAGD